MAGLLPTFGIPAYVNTDEAFYPATSDTFAGEPADAKYYSDWATWQLPYGCYNVNGKIIAVWWSTVTIGAEFKILCEARFITPASPPVLGEVAKIYEDSVVRVVAGAFGFYDQQTMSNAIIDSSLYLQCGLYEQQGTFGSGQTLHRLFLKIDCSGEVPVVAATRDDTYFAANFFAPSETVTYHLANVAGRLLALPFYTDNEVTSYPAMELDLDDLTAVWEDNNWADGTIIHLLGAGPYYSQAQVALVASSDTTTTWLWDWYDDFWSVTLNSNGITIANQTTLIDTSVAGVTIPQYYDGSPVQISGFIEQSDVSLYPNIRGKKASNSMIMSNYGFLAWEVWFDGSAFQYETMWMYDFNNQNGPTWVLGNYGGNYPSGYGYAFSNGPSFAYAQEVTGNELAFMPLFGVDDPALDNTNEIYVNVGWDNVAEESKAAFVHEPWADQTSWAPFVVAAQLSTGAGILLERSGYPWDEYGTYWWDGGTAPAGKINAIPFFLGQPNLDGALSEQRRKFWRPRAAW